jgi:hypothetical protein
MVDLSNGYSGSVVSVYLRCGRSCSGLVPNNFPCAKKWDEWLLMMISATCLSFIAWDHIIINRCGLHRFPQQIGNRASFYQWMALATPEFTTHRNAVEMHYNQGMLLFEKVD